MDRAEAFVYDGDDVVLVFDNTAAWQHRFLHGDAVDQVFLQEDVGEILWGLADNQGTIRDVANYDPTLDESEVFNHLEFDSFGNITAESNGSIEFRYAYTGRYFDDDTDLQYNRARWYDATVGRWISEDPIGFAAGDANVSRYVFNSPTNLNDPAGLAADDNSPASFGLHGDPSLWATNQPAEYANWYRTMMDTMKSQAFIASGGAMGNTSTWMEQHVWQGPIGNALQSQAVDTGMHWANGFSQGVLDTGSTIVTLGQWQYSDWQSNLWQEAYGTPAPTNQTAYIAGVGVTVLVGGAAAAPTLIGAYDTASIYIYSHGSAWWTTTFGAGAAAGGAAGTAANAARIERFREMLRRIFEEAMAARAAGDTARERLLWAQGEEIRQLLLQLMRFR